VTLCNAGHLNPLLVDGDKTEFLATAVGIPLGIGEGTYKPVTFSVPAGATVITFTDGLVERRGESIDIGLKRLEEAARGHDGPLDELLTFIITELTDETSDDDIALLGFRWTN
jgi:serine phosphatase RsbU (regulator of sigma subunit)